MVNITAKSTVISPDFLVWKFCGKARFPHSFGRFARKNFHTKKSGGITIFFAVSQACLSFRVLDYYHYELKFLLIKFCLVLKLNIWIYVKVEPLPRFRFNKYQTNFYCLEKASCMRIPSCWNKLIKAPRLCPKV